MGMYKIPKLGEGGKGIEVVEQYLQDNEIKVLDDIVARYGLKVSHNPFYVVIVWDYTFRNSDDPKVFDEGVIIEGELKKVFFGL